LSPLETIFFRADGAFQNHCFDIDFYIIFFDGFVAVVYGIVKRFTDRFLRNNGHARFQVPNRL